MQSLGQRVGVTAAEDPVATMVKPLEPRPAPRPDLGAPSTCVLLKNMFDPAKYGAVPHSPSIFLFCRGA